MPRIALTQSQGRLEDLQELLEQRGYEILREPLIETQALLDEKTRLEAKKLLQCAWILFTSRTSVCVWQQLGISHNHGTPKPRFGAVGKRTAETLNKIGEHVTLIAESQNADNFAQMFLNHPEAASPVGLPQGDKAFVTLQQKLEQRGFETHPVVIYRTIPRPQTFHNVDIIVLASPSATAALSDPGQARIVAIGNTTLNAVRARGWQAVRSASPESEAILEAIEAMKGT